MTTTADPLRHAIHWFEIPGRDIDRAQAFDASVIGAALRREPMGHQTLAVLPHTAPGAGGALIAGLGSFVQVLDLDGNRVGLHAHA